MHRIEKIVKALALAALAAVVSVASPAGEENAPRPHMMYFYNPSCRLCTRTNEIVSAVEKKYEAAMSHQRFDIADEKEGLDNVLYMFDLMDEMKVDEGDNVTLIVFLGILGEEDGEAVFTPERVLVEGDNIIENLDREAADFLEIEGKGGQTLGMNRPASFFRLHDRPGVRAG